MPRTLRPTATPATGSIVIAVNRNNKLSCPCFTLFRPANDSYQVGRVYVIIFGNKPLKRARIVAKKTLTLEKVNEWIARLDCGGNLEEFTALIRKEFTGKVVVERAQFDYLLMETVE